MPASCQLIFRVSFGHAFFSDGVLRDLRVVPVPACFDRLRRAGLLLRPEEGGIAAYGDEKAVARLRLHIAEAGTSLGMAFQVFFTDPQFFDYTAPAWPKGKLLFLDSADAVTGDAGCRIMHATPFVDGGAFLDRAHARLAEILGERILGPTPAAVIRIEVSTGLLDMLDARQRHFHVRFDAAGNGWDDGRRGAGGADVDAVDPGARISFDHFAGVNIADRRHAHVFPPKGSMLVRDVPPRLGLRSPPACRDRLTAGSTPDRGRAGR